MEEFLHSHVYLYLNIEGKDKYFLCAYVSNIDETHITIIDKTKPEEEQKPISHRRVDILEIKPSNREPIVGANND